MILATIVCLLLPAYQMYLRYSHGQPFAPGLESLVEVRNRLEQPDFQPFQVRSKPLVFKPVPLSGTIEDSQIRRVLTTVEPRFNRREMMNTLPMPAVIHALRLWGSQAKFARKLEGPTALSGQKMVAILLDHKTFVENCRLYGPGLLRQSEFGIEVITKDDFSFEYNSSATHFGELGAEFAEIGLPADYPANTLDGHVGTIGEIIKDDAARYVEGAELEWLASASCRFAINNRPWTNRFGQVRSFDSIARNLLERKPGTGSCGGTHVPYALMSLLRADDEVHLLTVSTRKSIETYFVDLSALLVENQARNGYWPKEWWDSTDDALPGSIQSSKEEFMAAVRMTSHHLEWMSLADSEKYRPPAQTMRRAVSFLLGNWDRIEAILKADWHEYSNVSHAARCLALLGGFDVYETHLDSASATIK